jgi:hypothetical protein
MFGTTIQQPIKKGVPTKDGFRPAPGFKGPDSPIGVHFATFQPNVDITKKNIRAPKPDSANMFTQIGMYSTQALMMPSCISITDKMSRFSSQGPGQGLGFNQSTPIHVPNWKQKGIFDAKMSIGNIGWAPGKPIIQSTS